jgi:1,6-anhydro-N-acetylmuramate kinase
MTICLGNSTILLSAGGSDFIDAARDPDRAFEGLGGPAPPASGHDCIDREAVRNWSVDFHFAGCDVVQTSRFHADVPIFLNNYDTPPPAMPRPCRQQSVVVRGVPQKQHFAVCGQT